MDRHRRELDLARRAASAAAVVCRAVQRRLSELRAITKDDRSPVTIADFASQAVISHVLARESNAPLVAEEASDALRDPAHREHARATLGVLSAVWPEADHESMLAAIDRGAGEPRREGFWTLDPIDGTKGFLRAQQYAVSLAYIEDWRPVVGVLACPNLSPEIARSPDDADAVGVLAGAVAGQGAFTLDPGHAQPGPPLRCAQLPPDTLTVASSVEASHTSQDAVSRVLTPLGIPVSHLHVDSQCKYLLVARAQADLYLRIPSKNGYVERIWDHAAGALVALEAGCTVTDLRGSPLDFSRGRGLDANRGIVCAPPWLHRRIIASAHALGLS